MKECCDLKGFLSFLVLKMISKKELSGEQIRKEIEKRKGQKPSPGTIYPVLKSLKIAGFIEEATEGKKEKKYKITRKGKKEVDIATKKFCALFYDIEELRKNI
ncbi:MAG: PadR family transcriptional regulator [Nanoarchaeota archaeon]